MKRAIISGAAAAGFFALSYALATQVYGNAAMGEWFVLASLASGVAGVLSCIATAVCVADEA